MKKLKDCEEAKKVEKMYEQILEMIDGRNNIHFKVNLIYAMQSHMTQLNLQAMGYKNVWIDNSGITTNGIPSFFTNGNYRSKFINIEHVIRYLEKEDFEEMGIWNYEGYVFAVYISSLEDCPYFENFCNDIEQNTNLLCKDISNSWKSYYYKLNHGVQAVAEIQKIFLEYKDKYSGLSNDRY